MKKSDSFREHAEKVLQEAKANGNIPESVEELVHELQVHQIELEMQNNELRDFPNGIVQPLRALS